PVRGEGAQGKPWSPGGRSGGWTSRRGGSRARRHRTTRGNKVADGNSAMLLKKIVVAEDDDAIAHLVNMALGDAGYLCLRAHDGVEAMNLVRVHAPDLLVLDVMMPRQSGHEVARKVKSDVILS